jgi:nicotinate-nucleotide--dimethylbenzimidazole phosphoribosyltransferase
MLAHTIGVIRPLDPAERAAARAAAAGASATVLFAGDHGVCAATHDRVPADATARLVAAVLDDGPAPVTVVDVGVAGPLEPRSGLVVRNVRAGSRDFTAEPALTPEEVRAAVEIGIGTVDNVLDEGAGMLVAGGIGIGGTAPALALIATLTVARWDGVSAAYSTGGDPDGSRARTLMAVRHGLARHRPDPADPLGVLAAVGGLEHAALAGCVLAAAAHRVPVLLTTGLVGQSAAAVAVALAPASAGVIGSEHWSDDPARVPGSR